MSTTSKIYKSLADFQQEVPVIHKDTQGYGYSYADLPKIFEVINPILKKYSLGFTQPIDGNYIKTILFHTETGETIESSTAIPEGVQMKGLNDFQVLGSAITYLRRYALSSILGLVTDKDNDAAGEQSGKPKGTQKNTSPSKWLNVGSEEWKALVKTVEGGVTITLAQIKKKYNVSGETQKELETLNIF